VVKGTHRGAKGPWPPAVESAEAMPGHYKFLAKAGDALLMDIRVWHAVSGTLS
jgi:hypothetical protein